MNVVYSTFKRTTDVVQSDTRSSRMLRVREKSNFLGKNGRLQSIVGHCISVVITSQNLTKYKQRCDFKCIYNTSIGILDIVFTIHYIPTNSLYNIATRPPKKLQHWQMGPFVAVILRQHGAVYYIQFRFPFSVKSQHS